MSEATYAPTGYPLPVEDKTAQKLASASVKVKTVFDVFAWIILVATVLTTVGFLIAAAAEHQSYIDPYSDNYVDDTASYIVVAIIAPLYGAFLWGTVKFYAIVAGYVHWRAK